MTQTDLPFSYIATKPDHLSQAINPIRQISLNALYAAEGVIHQNKKSELTTDILIQTLKTLSNEQSGRLKVQLSDLCFSDECGDTIAGVMGSRGASRLKSSTGIFAFNQECNLLKNAIFDHQLPIDIVIPFVRTPSDAATMIDRLAERGLCRHTNSIRLYLTCQVPANLINIEQLAAYFDGIIFDLDELSSFMLGIDFYQKSTLSYQKDNDAIRTFIKQAIDKVRPMEKDFSVMVNENEKGFIRWLTDTGTRVILKPSV